MFTVIHSGFLVDGDINEFVDDIAPTLLAESRRVGNVSIASRSVSEADLELLRSLGPQEHEGDEPISPLSRALMSDRWSQERGVPSGSAIRLSFVRDGYGNIVGVPLYKNFSIYQKVKEHRMTRDWEYSDGCHDKPFCVSDKEWEQRRISWECVSQNNPSDKILEREFDDGNAFDCSMPDNSDLWDHLQEFTPTPEERAHDLVVADFFRAGVSVEDTCEFFSHSNADERQRRGYEDALSELARSLPTPSREYVSESHDVDDNVAALARKVVENSGYSH